MPSCVVKCCKNNSKLHKKSDGVTFHNFPKDPNRRKRWIEIIRNCRNENNWSPTWHTLICNSHFDDSDLYITTNGLRRLTKSAVPKRVLFGTSNKLSIEFVKSEDPMICQNVLFDLSKVKVEEDALLETSTDTQRDSIDFSKVKVEDDAQIDSSTESPQVLRDIIKTECCGENHESYHYDKFYRQESLLEFSVSLTPDSKNRPIIDSPDKELLKKQLKIQQTKVNVHKKKIKIKSRSEKTTNKKKIT